MRQTKRSHKKKESPGSRPAKGKPAKGGGKGKKGKGKKSGKGGAKAPIQEVDILSPAAMLNVYYIAHNAADCLVLRGYPWPGSIKKGKKRK
uniref:Small lysine-rich protein 1 n=1 Tax=Geotrypetes seraphini TaxID=260995 RepID=A0A6P8SAM6_GEOSA|nr:small lysine-rich protein 1 [Geotrypetes seraphini]